MTCVVIRGITHVMFAGVGIADSTACGRLAGEDDPRVEGETDCMACIAAGIHWGSVTYVPGKATVSIPIVRLDWPGKGWPP